MLVSVIMIAQKESNSWSELLSSEMTSMAFPTN